MDMLVVWRVIREFCNPSALWIPGDCFEEASRSREISRGGNQLIFFKKTVSGWMVGAWSTNGFLGSWFYLEIFREAKVRCLKDMFLGALCEETVTKTVCTTELLWGFLRSFQK